MRHALVVVLGSISVAWSIALLVEMLGDTDYGVRWAAAERLARRTGDPFVQDWLTEELASWDKSSGFARSLKMQERLLWIAPSHVSSLSSPELSAGHLWEKVHANSEALVPGSLGSESSLAQGIKLAALAGVGVDTALVRTMIQDSRFWFARVELLQAIALLPPNVRRDARDVLRDARHDRHPLVRAAARLTARVPPGGDWRPWLWVNERRTLTDGASRLSSVSLLLIADVLTLLNLYLAGDQTVRDSAGALEHLPPCLSRSDARGHLDALDCAVGCTFGLCPYPLSGDYWSRGRFPESFAQRVREAVAKVGAPPWYEGSSESYARFWDSPRRS